MKLMTRQIRTSLKNCHSDMQLTLEDDINVPDSKPDIEHIIKIQGEIHVQETSAETDRAIIRGQLSFSLLYLSDVDFRQIHTMQGQIPFEESINLENANPDLEVHCHYDLEDCRASLINSRKISVRAILSLHCCQEEEHILAIGTGIVSDDAVQAEMGDPTPPAGVEQQLAPMSVNTMTSHQKDLFRIKDETSLPKGKPSCENVLYYELSTQGLATRLVDDGIRITGDLLIFVLYTPEDDERNLEYFETELPFDGIVSCSGCHEDMVADIEIVPGKKSLECRSDEDGEMRIFDVELSLLLDIKFYEEEHFDCLQDAYSTSCDLRLTKSNSHAKQLLLKNQSAVRVSDHIKVDPEKDNILQICNATGTIQIDEQTIVTDGISIEGAVELDILYITEDDLHPLNVLQASIPFQHTIEVRGISPEDDYELQTDISSINVLMLDREELEAKLVLNLCVLVFTECCNDVVTDIEEHEIDMETFQQMPGLVCYVVQTGDTLWDIAKLFRTTTNDIRTINELESDAVTPGDKLILLKQTDGIL